MDNEVIFLTTSEVAEIRKVGDRAIRKAIEKGKINAQYTNTTFKGGKNGQILVIPITELEPKEQRKYLKSIGKLEVAVALMDPLPVKPIDSYTFNERKRIDSCHLAVKDWEKYKLQHKELEAVTAGKRFSKENKNNYPFVTLSMQKLYRWQKAIEEKDFDKLIEKRGKHAKGTNTIPKEVWTTFLLHYLDQAQHPILQCFNYTKLYFEKEFPTLVNTIPSYSAFYRALETIPQEVVLYGRQGEKSYYDKAKPYIERIYEDIEVNEVWVADAHTFDIMSYQDGTEKVHRLTLVAFADARSRAIVGWTITDNTCSDAVLLALKRGIQRHGIPKFIYVDNGTEFLCFDIGGRGHRKEKIDFEVPPGVFARLGIEMWNATVCNPRTKIIERLFLSVKNHFSRLFKGFTGGSVAEKPDQLKYVLKSGKGMRHDYEIISKFDLFVEGIYNETPQSGQGMNNRSPYDVMNDEIYIRRTAPAEDLRLMLLRSTRMQTVGRNGVRLEVSGQKIWYFEHNFKMFYEGKRVYLRYDPADLTLVRVYDENHKFIQEVPVCNEFILKYAAGKEQVKEAIRKVNAHGKLVRNYIKNIGLEALPKLEAMDLVMWKAEKNIEERMLIAATEPKIEEIVRANEEAAYTDIEYTPVPINLDVMNSAREDFRVKNII